MHLANLYAVGGLTPGVSTRERELHAVRLLDPIFLADLALRRSSWW